MSGCALFLAGVGAAALVYLTWRTVWYFIARFLMGNPPGDRW